jgi:hypothetical protein
MSDQARVEQFEAEHRPHGATAHHCRDVARHGRLSFHAECPCGAELIVPLPEPDGGAGTPSPGDVKP